MALMTTSSLHITNGPSQRDLELAFIARNLGAEASFTVFVQDSPIVVGVKIYNFDFVTGHGPNYKLGGQLTQLRMENKNRLPPFNWIYILYNAMDRKGTMTFSNAE